MSTAVLVGAGVVALGALAAFAMPGRPRAEREPAQVRPEVEEAA